MKPWNLYYFYLKKKCIQIYGGRHDLIPSLLSPYSRGQQDVAVVLEIVNGAASQHDICQDVAPKAVEHGAEPRGHGAATGDLHRACDAQWGRSQGKSSSQHTLMVSVILQSICIVMHRQPGHSEMNRCWFDIISSDFSTCFINDNKSNPLIP